MIEVRSLRIELPGAAGTAVDGVSFSLAPGECLAIVGASGAGKSMLARALIGLTPGGTVVAAERLTVGGFDIRAFGESDWQALRGGVVSLVSQDALVALDPLRRIGREVAEPIEIHEKRMPRAARERRVQLLLARVALPEPLLRARQYPHELSGGLRQRALIAAALAAGPALLIADEPTTALDVTVQAKILRLLAELKESGIAVLLISHDLAVVASLADRIAVMQHGRFVEVAPAATLLTAPQHPYTRELLAAAAQHRAAGVTEQTQAAAPVLSTHSLVKSYRSTGRTVRAVGGVSFDLAAGGTVGIVGESGSGKTTVARLLLGIERPDTGTVQLYGEQWSGVPESKRRVRRRQIQLIHQDSLGTFDPRHSVRRVLAEAVTLDRSVSRAARLGRIRELLAQVELPETLLGRRAHELSGGQRQRVAIARALARRPSILVLDEPVSALDVLIQAHVLDLLVSLRQQLGLAMVFISHDLAVVRGLCDQVLVMKDGQVVEQGATEDLFREPQHPFTRELLGAHVAALADGQ